LKYLAGELWTEITRYHIFHYGPWVKPGFDSYSGKKQRGHIPVK